ncbi:unnamed protein product [Durusdinium trenchii]|uniref:Uncharacterized protein n=1 Tax=Durusdinium trenchii TaxID=1381693 RepID=A0ABP0M4G0_9DINO
MKEAMRSSQQRQAWIKVLLVAHFLGAAADFDTPSVDCDDSGLGLVQVQAQYRRDAELGQSMTSAGIEVATKSGSFQFWQGVRETGTTCMFHGCPERFGSVECHHWRCVCKEGFRYYPVDDGTCIAQDSTQARQFTNGTCFISKCPYKYGLTRCLGHRCLCLEGFEVREGAYHGQQVFVADVGSPGI